MLLLPRPTPAALASLVESAVSKRSPLIGKATHARIIKSFEPNLPPFLYNHLTNMYSKLDIPNSAQLVLQLNPSRNVVSWTSLIAGAVQSGRFTASVTHFINMLRENIEPNDFTLPCLFKACAALKVVNLGRGVHGYALKSGQIVDGFVGCAAFDMYCKTGLRRDAEMLFDEMPERNLGIWNACISNAVFDGQAERAVGKFVEFRRVGGGGGDSITFCAVLNACVDGGYVEFGRMLHGYVVRSGNEGDVFVSNGLVDFYGKCKLVTDAEMVFEGMGLRNDVSWCTMVAVFVQNDEEEKACEMFLEARKEGVEPNNFLVSSVLSALAGLTGLELGRSVHALVVKACIEENVYVGSSLVYMYGKCGSLEDAEVIFYDMQERNLVCWNALIGAYAHQGCADMAVQLLEEMTTGSREAVPNYVTLVCVLSACSRAGAVDIGMRIFESMWERYRIEPGEEHYACVVDLLARAGRLDCAYEFIKKLPIRPTISIWGALLHACKVYGNPDLGMIAAEHLFKLDPKDSGNHVILSNMLAATGRWEEATLVRKEMKDVGIKKGTGYSWVSVKNEVHVFQAKDTSHKRNSEIQEMLAKLRRDMRAAGYMPDTNFALYDLEDEEKVSEVWYHSEKIALAFGLVVVPPGVPIRITKNLRICGDCHTAFKFISHIASREIIVRDNNRFHTFRQGKCSCGDYW